MRKWLAFGITVPFVAMMWAGCNGGDDTTDAGDAAQDVKIDKKPLPETSVPDTGPTCPTPYATIDTSQVTWVPPITPNPTACSDVQISTYFDACLGTNSSSQACNAFVQSSTNATCLGCLVTNSNASAYGALISVGGVDYANISGCIAIVTGDTSATGCGAKSEAVTQCESLACGDLCPVTDNASFALYQQCTQSADSAVCKSYVDAECDLSDAGAVYAECVNHSGFQDYYTALAPIFCGGYATDGGVSDAGTDAATTDAATTDAADDGATTDAADDGATDATTD